MWVFLFFLFSLYLKIYIIRVVVDNNSATVVLTEEFVNGCVHLKRSRIRPH